MDLCSINTKISIIKQTKKEKAISTANMIQHKTKNS